MNLQKENMIIKQMMALMFTRQHQNSFFSQNFKISSQYEFYTSDKYCLLFKSNYYLTVKCSETLQMFLILERYAITWIKNLKMHEKIIYIFKCIRYSYFIRITSSFFGFIFEIYSLADCC